MLGGGVGGWGSGQLMTNDVDVARAHVSRYNNIIIYNILHSRVVHLLSYPDIDRKIVGVVGLGSHMNHTVALIARDDSRVTRR